MDVHKNARLTPAGRDHPAEAPHLEDDTAFLSTPILKPGTRLVREWHGHVHRVIVVEDGFYYDGARYRSLTEIASRITGSRRSGPLFFGLKCRPSSALPTTGDA